LLFVFSPLNGFALETQRSPCRYCLTTGSIALSLSGGSIARKDTDISFLAQETTNGLITLSIVIVEREKKNSSTWWLLSLPSRQNIGCGDKKGSAS
jgi:hypothetical protein